MFAETNVEPTLTNANSSPMKIASIVIRFFIFIPLTNMLYYSQDVRQALWWPVCKKEGYILISDIKKAIIHLDNIRIQKNMTVEKLCDGICGDRQYRKYVSGYTNISEKRLMEFVNKLGISARDFYFSLSI